jgi:hypothetical protein
MPQCTATQNNNKKVYIFQDALALKMCVGHLHTVHCSPHYEDENRIMLWNSICDFYNNIWHIMELTLLSTGKAIQVDFPWL